MYITLSFQICRFCWNKIRTEGNGNCPACRSAYSENPADFKPLTAEEMAKIKAEKRQKDQAKKQKISENRKHLANVRVVQKNLVFVVGLSPRLADAEVLKKPEYFGKFGKMHKVAINLNTAYAGNQNQVYIITLILLVKLILEIDFNLIKPNHPNHYITYIANGLILFSPRIH